VTNPIPFYRQVLRALKAADVPFLIGGGYATARHTRIDRRVKDLDLMIRRADWAPTAHALRAVRIHTYLPFPHWLGKAQARGAVVDIIFSSGNAIVAVDDAWFERAETTRVLGFTVKLCPPEELLWSKAFIMERERFDGADVMHLIRACGRALDWEHLCRRFRGHERVLLMHALMFGYVYPNEADVVPGWVIERLYAVPIASSPTGRKVCRGTNLSRAQYLIDIQKWGYADARLPPFGRMTPRERSMWTKAIR
jgi:hypothetical protein